MRILQIVGATALLSSSAFAQVRVEVMAPPPPRVQIVAPPPPRVVVAPPVVHVAAPTVHFVAAPPLVEVQPGVQVVEDNDEEVFFTDGYYWHCSPDGVWFRTRNWRGGWVQAPPRVVPVALGRMPRGEYRHYRREAREQRHEERRMERDDRKAERRAEKDERKWEKHHGR